MLDSCGNIAGLPAADKAKFHQIIAPGKRAACVLHTSGLFHAAHSPGGGRIHLGGKLCAKAEQRSGNQMFCSLIFFLLTNAIKSTMDPCAVTSGLCYQKKSVS